MSPNLLLGIIIGITLTISVIYGFYYLFYIHKNQEIRTNTFSKNRNISKFQSLSNRKEASDELQKKLIQMLDGDREEAERLVAKERFGRYGKSEAYYWWKAIQKLEYKRQQNSKQNEN